MHGCPAALQTCSPRCLKSWSSKRDAEYQKPPQTPALDLNLKTLIIAIFSQGSNTCDDLRINVLSSRRPLLNRSQFFLKPEAFASDESLLRLRGLELLSKHDQTVFPRKFISTRPSGASWCAFLGGRLVVAEIESALGALSLLRPRQEVRVRANMLGRKTTGNP